MPCPRVQVDAPQCPVFLCLNLLFDLILLSRPGFVSISLYSHISELFPKSSLATSSSTPSTRQLEQLAFTSFLSGIASGAAISVTSTPFELVKIRRQLEVAIAKDAGQTPGRDLGTIGSIKAIMRTNKGWTRGLYTGFGPHLSESEGFTAID